MPTALSEYPYSCTMLVSTTYIFSFMIPNLNGLPNFATNGFPNMQPPLPFPPGNFAPRLDLHTAQATNGTPHTGPIGE